MKIHIKFLLTFLSVLLGIVGSVFSADVIGYWSFDEGRGAVATDRSGNAAHGLIFGKADWVPGKSGSALHFNGVDTLMDCGSTPFLTAPRPSYSVEFWIRRDRLGSAEEICGQGWDHRLFFQGNDTLWIMERKNGKDVPLGEPKPSIVETNVWYHIAYVREALSGHITSSFYVNGVRTATRTASEADASPLPLVFGKPIPRRFQGSLDEWVIWSRALEPKEILDHLNGKQDLFKTMRGAAISLGVDDEKRILTNLFLPRWKPSAPGGIFNPGEKQVFEVSIPAPPEGMKLKLAGLTIRDIEENICASFPDIELDEKNQFSAKVTAALESNGYYTLWGLVQNEKSISTPPVVRSFAILPDTGLRNPDPGSPFGVCTHYENPHWLHEHPELPAIQKKLGIAFFREEFRWATIAETGKLSPLAGLAKEHNLSWLPLVNYVPAKNGVVKNGVYVWEEDMAKLRKAFDLHRGFFAMYESQNEPNNFGGWSKLFPGGAPVWLADNWGKPFCDLVIAMRKVLAASDPQAKLLWPDLDIPDWVGKFASNFGAAASIDGVAPHPYCLHGQIPETQDWVVAAPDYLAMLDRHKIPRRIWITEIGFPTHQNINYQDTQVAYRPLSENDQAAWLVRAMLTHFAWGVEKIFWYDLYEDGKEDKNAEHHFGLLRHGTCAPKPAAVAYANLIHQTRWAKRIEKMRSLPEHTLGYLVSMNGDPLTILWRTQGKGSYSLPSTGPELMLIDMYGRETKLPEKNGRREIPLTTDPVYVRVAGGSQKP